MIVIQIVALLVVSLHPSSSHLMLGFDISATEQLQLEYLINLLAEFSSFDFILHFENDANVLWVNTMTRRIHVKGEQCLISLSVNDSGYKNFQRPNSKAHVVHVVMFDDLSTFRMHLVHYRNVILYHTVIFLVRRKQQYDSNFWNEENLRYAGRILIVDTSANADLIRVYTKCFYCGHFSKQLVLVAKTNESTLELSRHVLLPRTFRNLHGSHIQVANFDYFPFVFCRKPDSKYHEGRCKHLGGIEWNLLEVVSQRLNFTFNIQKKGLDVFDAIVNGSIDLAIGGIAITQKRFLSGTFTNFIHYEDFRLLYVCHVSWWTILKIYVVPFQLNVWITSFVCLFATAICIRWFVQSEKHLSFGHSVMICFKLLVEQSNRRIPSLASLWSPLLIFLSLFITCNVLGTSYKCILASIRVRPPHLEYHNEDDLIKQGYRIIVDKTGKLKYFRDLFSKEDPFLIHMEMKGIHIESFCDQIAYLLQNKAALFEEGSALRYLSLYECFNITQKPIEGWYDPSKLRLTTEVIRTAPHAWGLAPATPYWKAINNIIGNLQNGGIIKKWTRDALLEIQARTPLANSKNNMVEEKISDMQTYAFIFLLYLCGNLISIITFILETIISNIASHRI